MDCLDRINTTNPFGESGFLFSERIAEKYYNAIRNFEIDCPTYEVLRAIGPYEDGERFVEMASKDLNKELLDKAKEKITHRTKPISTKTIEDIAFGCIRREYTESHKNPLTRFLSRIISRRTLRNVPFYYFLEKAYQKELLKLVPE